MRREKAVGNGPIKNNDLNDQVRVDNGKTHDIPSGFIQGRTSLFNGCFKCDSTSKTVKYIGHLGT